MPSIRESFNQICHQIEHTEGKLDKTDVTELQILREHTDYLSVIGVHKDTVFSASGDMNIYLHRFPTGKQHYDMLRTQERNSVAVLYQVTVEISEGHVLIIIVSGSTIRLRPVSGAAHDQVSGKTVQSGKMRISQVQLELPGANLQTRPDKMRHLL